MTKIIKCKCGRKTVLKPTDDINRRKCPSCGSTGEYTRMSEDDVTWD